jgi:hypothetical protein
MNLQYLSFETNNRCNYIKEHPWCPINDPLRYPSHESKIPCSDEIIVKFTCKMIEYGFKGKIGWHYYNEPMITINRCLRLMNQIRSKHNSTEFVLWTNGYKIDKGSPAWLPMFNQISVSLYNEEDTARVIPATEGIPGVSCVPAPHDARKQIYDLAPDNPGGCRRPRDIEMPLNYYGNLRMCCSDFRGHVSMGNIMTEDHDLLIKMWFEMAEKVAAGEVHLCGQCRSTHSPVVL